MNSNGVDRAVPDPKAALRYTRARSAVMTPSQKQRHETDVLSTFEQLKTWVKWWHYTVISFFPLAFGSESKVAGKQPRRPSKPKNAQPEVTPVTKGSMFSQSTHQQPSHFTIHPQWASEANDTSAKKLVEKQLRRLGRSLCYMTRLLLMSMFMVYNLDKMHY